MIVTVPDDYQNLVRTLDCCASLASHELRIFRGPARDLDELTAQLRDAEAIVAIRERTDFSRELIARLPRLRQISQTGRSAHTVDIAACTERGIVVTAGTQVSPYTVAEHTWALIFALTRDVAGQAENMRQGQWSSHLSAGLRGRTLGIFGLGKIGSLVAAAGNAFGMKLLVWGREASRQRAQAAGYEVAASKEDLFARSDVLSLNLHLNPATRGIVTAADFALMKPTALFVNASRAAMIVPGALEQALRNGRPGRAAVDVYHEEPVLGGDHPLLRMENALCTPHSAWIEKETYELYFGEAFEQVAAFARGEKVNILNPEALQR